LIKLIKKKIEDNPRRCHEVLSKALWAHCISRHGATNVTPFECVYGQEVVLPVEVNLAAYRFAKKNELSAVNYHDLMMDNISMSVYFSINFIHYPPMFHAFMRIT
jgi:hypothetical protein